MNRNFKAPAALHAPQASFTAAKPRAPQSAANTGRISWFNNYNEEWEAYSEEHAIACRRRPAAEDLEILPRVWNTPGGFLTRR